MSHSGTPRGRFITLEGVDGAGKSTHVQWLLEHLQSRGLQVLATREPGGTPLGEQLRECLLHQPMHLRTETLLMFAARNEHLEALIRPALAAGTWVVCDRFTDATYAYQGGGRELGEEAVQALENWVHPDIQPDCTFFFDVPLKVARERLARSRDYDRFEREDEVFFERTRAAYHQRVHQAPERFLVLDGTLAIDALRRQLGQRIDILVGADSPA